MTAREKSHYTPKPQTKCWECEWAAGKDHKCPWANEFKPVPGWKAEQTQVLVANGNYTGDGKPQYVDSFIVKECPLFEEMQFIKRQRAEIAKKLEANKSIIKDKDKSLELVARLWIDEHKDISQIVAETGLPYWKVAYYQRTIKERIKNGK